jgi:hypothetical protein
LSFDLVKRPKPNSLLFSSFSNIAPKFSSFFLPGPWLTFFFHSFLWVFNPWLSSVVDFSTQNFSFFPSRPVHDFSSLISSILLFIFPFFFLHSKPESGEGEQGKRWCSAGGELSGSGEAATEQREKHGRWCTVIVGSGSVARNGSTGPGICSSS